MPVLTPSALRRTRAPGVPAPACVRDGPGVPGPSPCLFQSGRGGRDPLGAEAGDPLGAEGTVRTPGGSPPGPRGPATAGAPG
ncbi:hypothetical protein GCM10010266_33340 [Streptomyces griseomycini]|nr:hypothetical protein GCM10010266_33340 [Streptomyces griseomycini]GGR22347.1 hypothetical protein GCM10015536_30270 [Streptomyces griseomycini]